MPIAQSTYADGFIERIQQCLEWQACIRLQFLLDFLNLCNAVLQISIKQAMKCLGLVGSDKGIECSYFDKVV